MLHCPFKVLLNSHCNHCWCQRLTKLTWSWWTKQVSVEGSYGNLYDLDFKLYFTIDLCKPTVQHSMSVFQEPTIITILTHHWMSKLKCKPQWNFWKWLKHEPMKCFWMHSVSFIRKKHCKQDQQLNPFTAVLTVPSLWKWPVNAPDLKSLRLFPPSHEHKKGFLSKYTVLGVLTIDLL